MDQREFAQALANGARYSAEQKAHREEVERLKAINTELLGALERIMRRHYNDTFGDHDSFCSWHGGDVCTCGGEEARAAITKARGQS